MSKTIPFFPRSVSNIVVNLFNQVFNQVIIATGGIVIKKLIVKGNVNVDGLSTNNNNLVVEKKVTINGNLVINGSLTISGQSLLAIPTGTILPYVSLNTPSNDWLICDGSSYNITAYPDLFNIIGTTFGSTSDTTFNVPDLRGRALTGADAGAGRMLTNNQLGNVSGVEKVLLETRQMPLHSHVGISTPGGVHMHSWNATDFTTTGLHSHTSIGTQTNGHSHQMNFTTINGKIPGTGSYVNFPLTGAASISSVSPSNPPNYPDTNYNSLYAPAVATGIASNGNHTHDWSSITGTTTTESGHRHNVTNIESIGNSQPHNNLQPYAVFNFIIKI